MLTYDGGVRVTKQLIVVKETAGNSILYGKHTYHGGIFLHICKDLFEGSAADELHLLALEIQMGCHIVERTGLTLDGYSLHTVLILNTNPASIEAGN